MKNTWFLTILSCSMVNLLYSQASQPILLEVEGLFRLAIMIIQRQIQARYVTMALTFKAILRMDGYH